MDTTRALTHAQVAAIRRLDVPLRDKALLRMLYETTARARPVPTRPRQPHPQPRPAVGSPHAAATHPDRR